jgi:ribonuclease HI
MPRGSKRAKAQAPRPERLFGEPEQPADLFVAHVDGASRNNPGPAAYGVVLRRPDGGTLETLSRYIGTKTNNEAEYFGLIAALDCALSHRIARLRVVSDSELLVQQMRGNYKVKSATLRPLHEQARKLAGGFAYITFEHVPRAQNAEADALANAALGSSRSQDSGVRSQGKSGPRNSKLETRAEKPTTSHSPLAPQKIRARYANGALHPVQPLSLNEGEEVEITVKKLSD